MDNFFTLHLTNCLLNIKDVEFDFRMGCMYTCLISVFMNNKHAIYEFLIFEFSIFLFSNTVILAYSDPKLPFLSSKLL